MAQLGETQSASRAFERGLSMATAATPTATAAPALPAPSGRIAI